MAQRPNVRNFNEIVRAEGFLFKSRKTMGIRVINSSGSSIAANKVVALVGYNTTAKLPKIVLADADVAGHRDLYVTKQAIANGSKGNVFTGFMSTADQNTNSVTTVGDPVYLSTTAGAFTVTAPTAGNARQVIVGYAQVKSATIGQIAWDIHAPDKLGSFDVNGVGFTVGEGGAVTQATSKSTAVTLDKKTGAITMNNAALGAVGVVSFTLTDAFIEANDMLLMNHISGGTVGVYAFQAQCGAGSAVINVMNNSAGSLSEAVVIQFAVVKGAIA